MKKTTLSVVATVLAIVAGVTIAGKADAQQANQFRCVQGPLDKVCQDLYGNSSQTVWDSYGNERTTFSNGRVVECKIQGFGQYACVDSFGVRFDKTRDAFGNERFTYLDGRVVNCAHVGFGNFTCR